MTPTRDTLLKEVMVALEPFTPADVECLFDQAAAVVDQLTKAGMIGEGE